MRDDERLSGLADRWRDAERERYELYDRACTDVGEAPLSFEAWRMAGEPRAERQREHSEYSRRLLEIGLAPMSIGDWARRRWGIEHEVALAVEQVFGRTRDALPPPCAELDADSISQLRRAYLEHRRFAIRAGLQPSSLETWFATTEAPAVRELHAKALKARDERVLEAKRRVRRERVAGVRFDDPADALAIASGRFNATVPALRVVRSWLEASAAAGQRVLVLVGPPGTGKTFAAAWALAELGGAFVKSDELARCSLARFGDDRARFTGLVETRGVLIVDEVGCDERLARDERLALASVVADRGSVNGDAYPTILVSNLDAHRLEQLLDERTVDRLSAFGAIETVTGASLRSRAKRAGWRRTEER